MQSSYQINTDTHVIYCGAHEAPGYRFRGRVIIYEGKTIHDPIVFQDESADTFPTTRAARGWAEARATSWLEDHGIRVNVHQ